MKYLLDTCVISEAVAKQPNQQVLQWLGSLDPNDVYLSVVTIGEIKKGIERLPASKRKDALDQWLRDDLLAQFRHRIIGLDVELMLQWGTLLARLEARGKMMPAVDAMIAAIAIQDDLTLVTRNETDFIESGARLFNPWK